MTARSQPGTPKALSHTVTPAPGVFLVRSGTSGKTYTVTPLPVIGGAICDCDFGKNNPWPHLCSHVRAVMIHAEQVLGKEMK